MDLLTVATAGSVDDGKSTLIGRLLLEADAVADDQLAAAAEVSRRRGDDVTDLSLFTDGLRAEREQAITIDVAHRYFGTAQRRFILADTPGHAEYTRNMVTGASRADVGLVLVDVRHGLTEQSRTHLAMLALLRVPHLVIALNKMDLVDWSRAIVREMHGELTAYSRKLAAAGLAPAAPTVIPVSALTGDNVTSPSARTPWYVGPTLLSHLEGLVVPHRASGPLRLPIQVTLRPGRGDPSKAREYAGQLASGALAVGDQVVVLPRGHSTTITGVAVPGRAVSEAGSPQSVSVTLADDLDVTRGDLIVHPDDLPTVTQDLRARIAWLHREPLRPGVRVLVKHTTRAVKAIVREVSDRLDISTLARIESPDALRCNDIGMVSIRLAEPLIVDPYAVNRHTGGFILIREDSGETLGAGMVSA